MKRRRHLSTGQQSCQCSASDERPAASDNGHEEERSGKITDEGGNPDVGQTDEGGSAMKKGCEHELQTIRDRGIQGTKSSSVP